MAQFAYATGAGIPLGGPGLGGPGTGYGSSGSGSTGYGSSGSSSGSTGYSSSGSTGYSGSGYGSSSSSSSSKASLLDALLDAPPTLPDMTYADRFLPGAHRTAAQTIIERILDRKSPYDRDPSLFKLTPDQIKRIACRGQTSDKIYQHVLSLAENEIGNQYTADQSPRGTKTMFLAFYDPAKSSSYYREAALRQMLSGICYQNDVEEYNAKRAALKKQLAAVTAFYKSTTAATSVRKAYQSFCEIRENVDDLLDQVKNSSPTDFTNADDRTVLKLLDQVCGISRPLQLKTLTHDDEEDLKSRVNAFLKGLATMSGSPVDKTSKKNYWCERPQRGGGMHVIASPAYDPKFNQFIKGLPKARYEKYEGTTAVADQVKLWRTFADGTFCQNNQLVLSGGARRTGGGSRRSGTRRTGGGTRRSGTRRATRRSGAKHSRRHSVRRR
jgi:hypothetical protein